MCSRLGSQAETEPGIIRSRRVRSGLHVRIHIQGFDSRKNDPQSPTDPLTFRSPIHALACPPCHCERSCQSACAEAGHCRKLYSHCSPPRRHPKPFLRWLMDRIAPALLPPSVGLTVLSSLESKPPSVHVPYYPPPPVCLCFRKFPRPDRGPMPYIS
jgi:hypothetical protein